MTVATVVRQFGPAYAARFGAALPAGHRRALEAGDPLDEFLENFPSVSRDQVIAVLELAKEMLLARAAAA